MQRDGQDREAAQHHDESVQEARAERAPEVAPSLREPLERPRELDRADRQRLAIVVGHVEPRHAGYRLETPGAVAVAPPAARPSTRSTSGSDQEPVTR